MSGARDRYQVTEAVARSLEYRKIQAQRWIQRETALNTISACFNSSDRLTPGTFANDVLQLLAAEPARSDEQRLAARALR